MLKTSKKILSIIMVVIMVLTAVPLSGFVGLELPALDWGFKASALASSGSCGPTATYTFDASTGELIISGTGAISDERFYNNSDIKSVIVEEGITKINYCAFSGCENLASVTLADSVTYIGDHAFSSCSNLVSLTLGKGLSSVSSLAFEDCYVKELTIGFKDIPSYAFNGLKHLKKVTLLEGVEVVSNRAFADCTNLETINFPNSLKYMGRDILQNTAWYNYKGKGLIIQDNWLYGYKGDVPAGYTLTIGDDVKNVAAGLLKGLVNTNLVAYEVSSDSKYLSTENGVLYNKDKTAIISYPIGKKDKTFTIPDSVTEIYGDAFLYHQLDEIYISSLENWCKIEFHNEYANPLSVPYTDLYIDGVKSSLLVIPDTITEIKPCAFNGSTQFKDIILHDGVTVIGDGALNTSSYLDSITFGKGVSKISSSYGMFSFKEIYYTGSQEEWEAVVKDGMDFINLYLMHTHEYTKTVIKEPSCTSDGEILYTCKHGDTITEIISTSGHNWVDMGGSVKTTCTTEGVDNYKCSNCGVEKKGTIPALDHNWEYIEITYATCDKDGYMLRACQREGCNAKEEKVTPATHDLNGLVTKDPTCTESGEEYIHCMACSYSFVEIMPVKGHTYSEWVELLPATCNERGLNIKICNDCNDIQRQIIPKLAHIDADGNGVCDTCENTDTPDVPDTPDEPDTPNEPDVPEDPSANCSCNCHKSGLSKIIFNLILFFQKLIRSNKTCTCGASHY